jgi:hypothetical protein
MGRVRKHYFNTIKPKTPGQITYEKRKLVAEGMSEVDASGSAYVSKDHIGALVTFQIHRKPKTRVRRPKNENSQPRNSNETE